MFLKINTAETKTMWSQGTRAISGATSMLGGIANVMVRHSSQTEKQFLRFQKMMRRLMRYASPTLRYDAYVYGEAHFWGKPSPVDIDPGIARIIDSYVTRAKAA
jgi:hypothetical protein